MKGSKAVSPCNKNEMKILVLNGSPKGKTSITLQTSNYLQALFQEDEFDVLHVGQRIKRFEKDMTEFLEKIKDCDLVLFSYPVYTFIAPYQLQRFIELMKESGVDFSNKYAAQISTSKHFYDVTAKKYIEENCADMGFKYIGALCADMDDLLCEKGRKEAVDFYKYILFCVKNEIFEKTFVQKPNTIKPYARQHFNIVAKSNRKKVAIVTTNKDDESLSNMIKDFVAVLPFESKVINLSSFHFSGGCLGCMSCASTGKCVWKDGFDTFLRNEIQSCDSIVYAFSIKDHSMGADFKLFDDRQFCNGHRTVTIGKPVGYIVSGDLDAENNLKTILEARAQVGENPLAHLAYGNEMQKEILVLSKKLTYMLNSEYSAAQNFYGVGGMKIFRDLIYTMQGFMKADHEFYKEHGFYDFPQKKVGTIVGMKFIGALMSNEKVEKEARKMMGTAMVMPYEKVISEAKSKKESK